MKEKVKLLVNLDKWEKIELADIKEGDKLLRICSYADGTVAEVRGKTHTKGSRGWLTKGNFILVRDYYGNGETVEIYRRKPKPFEFPLKPMAIIEGTYKFSSQDTRRYFRTEEGGWRNARDGGVAFVEALRGNFTNWKVISEGTDV